MSPSPWQQYGRISLLLLPSVARASLQLGELVQADSICNLPDIPKNESAKYDFSDCLSRSAKLKRSCSVTCSDAWYGDDGTFECPKEKNATWSGTLPSCSKCATTKRPSAALPGLKDTCAEVARDETCTAVCASVAGEDNATKETFTCKKESTGWLKHCTCFSTGDEEPLDCDRCVAPDLGSEAALYDATDCSSGKEHQSCTVKCAPLRGDMQSTYTCVGPPYRTSGNLPTCSSGCDITSRPQDVWQQQGVVDSCGDALQPNQGCVAGCAEGFVGEEQLFVCLHKIDGNGGDGCSCFIGQQPKCVDMRMCRELPALPNATLLSKPPIADHGQARYQCAQGFTEDGKADGATVLELQCKDGYLRDYNLVGCSPVAQPPLWPECALNHSLSSNPTIDVSRCGDGSLVKRAGESCLVTCAPGYYEGTPRRFEAVGNLTSRAPYLWECHEGHFYGVMPQCMESHQFHEFDVYAVLKSGENDTLWYPWGEQVQEDASGSVPSNINMFDLEGLLQHIYTELLYFQQELAELPGLYRDSETGKWTGIAAPTFPVTRDEVDTAIWYRLRVQNPELVAPNLAYAEFGYFADFQHGGASNTDAATAFSDSGGTVGAAQQIPGFVKIYKAKPGSQATDAECRDPKWIGTADWREQCDEEEGPQFDPRYMPEDRFVRFSMPGVCPNLPYDQKRRGGGGFSSSCSTGPNGKVLQGGNCSSPSGEGDCTYSLQELARVPLAQLTGMSSQSCGGSACKSLRHFQVGCDSAQLRTGVKISQGGKGTSMRECSEYAVGGKVIPPNMSHECSINETVVKGKVWSCLEACNTSEHSTGVLQGRCSAEHNGNRLKQFRSMFQSALEQKSSGASLQQSQLAPLLQDCSIHGSCKPDTQLGLGYCHRDTTGLCTPCFVPNTSSFDPGRSLNMVPCRSDLFTSGGYASGGLPECDCGDDATSCLPCCTYLASCPRRWDTDQNWPSCPTSCGRRLQTRRAICVDASTLGDCRRSLGTGGGDPNGAGWCDEAGCYEAQVCEGKQCSWLPFCSAGSGGNDDPEPCMPTAWGPTDSGCAKGFEDRYTRCSFYDPTLDDQGRSFCPSDAQPDFRRGCKYTQKSRLPYCATCPLDHGVCSQCSAAQVFELKSPGQCSNSQALFEMDITLWIPLELKDSLVAFASQDLESILTSAVAAASSWPAGDIFFVDMFEDLSMPSNQAARSQGGLLARPSADGLFASRPNQVMTLLQSRRMRGSLEDAIDALGSNSSNKSNTTTTTTQTTTSTSNTTTTATSTNSTTTTTTTSTNSTTTTTTSTNTTGNTTTTTATSSTASTASAATTSTTPVPLPPTTALQAWRIKLVYRGDKVGKSGGVDRIAQATGHIQDKVNTALEQAFQVPPGVLHADVDYLSLLCPGLERAANSWSTCPTMSTWVKIIIAVVLIVLGGGLIAGAAWWLYMRHCR